MIIFQSTLSNPSKNQLVQKPSQHQPVKERTEIENRDKNYVNPEQGIDAAHNISEQNQFQNQISPRIIKQNGNECNVKLRKAHRAKRDQIKNH